jgi:hypothetical protein
MIDEINQKSLQSKFTCVNLCGNLWDYKVCIPKVALQEIAVTEVHLCLLTTFVSKNSSLKALVWKQKKHIKVSTLIFKYDLNPRI